MDQRAPSAADLAAIERRSRAATYLDGLLELLAGAILIVLAVVWAVSPVFVGVIGGLFGIFGGRFALRIKERLTYPRIGYSTDTSKASTLGARGVVTVLVLAIAFIVVVVAMLGDPGSTTDWRRVLPLLSGVLIGLGFWAASQRSGLLRHRLLAMASIGTGVLFTAIGSGVDFMPMTWQLATLGGLSMVIGVAALVSFVRRHPVPGDADRG